MSSHRFFLTGPLPVPADGHGAEAILVPLSSTDLHHLSHVLRLGAGEGIVVIEPEGDVWRLRVSSAGPDGCRAVRVAPLERAWLPHVTLVAGVAKSDRTDLVVEKAVELGVERIVPVLTERSVVRLTAEKARSRGDRWRRVAEAAAKQSQRSEVPVVSDPVELTAALRQMEAFDIVLVAWEEEAHTAPGVGEALDEMGATADSRVAVVVGPEGGLSAAEVYALERAGARSVSLGGTVLRAETAGIVATALAIYELGGLQGRARG